MKNSYQKTTIVFCVISLLVQVYLLVNYNQTMACKLVAKEKIALLTDAKYLFDTVSLSICALLWIWANFMVIKTRQFFWLWMPFVLVCFSIYHSCKMNNFNFVFLKQNNMWNGGFSISYVVGAFGILCAGIILLLDYLVLKKVVKK